MSVFEEAKPTKNIAHSFLRLVWRRLGLRKITFLRSFWAFIIRLWLILRHDPARTQSFFDQIYDEKADPWDYKRGIQQARYTCALEFFAEINNQQSFSRAVEIGCAEGQFTELLAEQCNSLLALDISSVAIARAKSKCRKFSHITFKEWDLSKDELLDSFHLVTAMDVLEYYYSPASLRAVRDKIVSLVAPQGYLLVTTSKTHEFIEKSRWARWLHYGSHLMTFISNHPNLVVCKQAEMELHIITLFRKK